MVDFKALAAPFPPDDISWRVGSTTKDKTKGMALAYLDARAVMDRLDAVCGPGGWQCSYSHAQAKTVCDIAIKVGDEWISKADGAGDSDIEAEKGALSDGFKRAAVRWGIGRYLYNIASPWVELEVSPEGRVKGIKKSEFARLNALLPKAPIVARENSMDAVDPADQHMVTGNGQSQYLIDKRKQAEDFLQKTLAAFSTMSGSDAVAQWYETPISPKGRSKNRDAAERLKENFPDLGDKLETAADNARMRFS